MSGLIQGMAIGFTAGIIPGPLLALYLSHAVRHGWRRTLPGVLAPLVSDGPIILLVVFILAQVPAGLLVALRIGGGFYLVYLAVRMIRRGDAAGAAAEPVHRHTHLFRTAVAINLLNPNPYIFWGIALGPVLVGLGRTDPTAAAAFVLGFYAAMLGVFTGWVVLFGKTAALPPMLRRRAQLAAGLIMAGFGLYQVGAGFVHLRILL